MIHSIDIPIWDCQLHLLLWPADLNAALAEANVTGEVLEEFLEKGNLGVTELNDDGWPVILINRERHGADLFGLLCHELFHAVQKMLSHRGVELSRKTNNETHAYLLDYLMREAYKIVIDKGVKGG